MQNNHISDKEVSSEKTDRYNKIFDFVEDIIKNEKVLSTFELGNLFQELYMFNKEITAEDCVFNR